MNTENVRKKSIRQLDHLIRHFPGNPDQRYSPWLREVAGWFRKLVEHKDFNSLVQDRVGRTFRVLQAGEPARKVYDSLIEILLDGYARIDRMPDNFWAGHRGFGGQHVSRK